MLAPPAQQNGGGSVHSEQGPSLDSASARRAPERLESSRHATSRDSSFLIPAQQILAICGNYDSIVYGQALTFETWKPKSKSSSASDKVCRVATGATKR